MIKTLKVHEKVYMFKDRADCFSTLVIGENRVLLWDLGCGIDNLKEAIQSITALPLLVICSHGHFDHIGNSFQFDEVFLSKEDFIILNHYDEKILNKWLQEMNEDDLNISFQFNNWKSIKELDFMEFDLGNLPCQIISMSGHSRGSVGVYIKKLRLLLSGDALTPIMCLIFLNHESKYVQLETLKRVNDLDFDYFLTSHHDRLMPKSIINKMIECIEQSKGKRFYQYQYPKPPYSDGWFYLHSFKDEPVGLIVENRDE